MIPLDLHYQWPQGAYLIVLSFIALCLFWLSYRWRQNLPFLPQLLRRPPTFLYWLKAACFSLGLFCLALALMMPAGNGHYPESPSPAAAEAKLNHVHLEFKRKAHQVILLIDVSASMAIQDAHLQKSRLDYAKEIADEIIASLTGEMAALDTFTSETFQLVPPTNDYIFTRLSIKEIAINEGGYAGTDFQQALSQMRERYFPPKAPALSTPALKTLIVLSDGGDTSLEAMPSDRQPAKIQDLANILQAAQAQHLRVYTIGMGSEGGGEVPDVSFEGKPVHSQLESSLLQALAKTGRGKYFEANRYAPPQLAQALMQEMAKDPPYYQEQEQDYTQLLLKNLLGGLIYERYFQIPLGLAIILFALALLLPSIPKRQLFLLVCSLALPLAASEPPDSQEGLFTVQLHEAEAYMQSGMFEEARGIYEALLALSLNARQKASLQFNIGSAYLLEGSWDPAIYSLSHISSEGLPLYLKQRISKNLALAYYEKALSMQAKFPNAAMQLFDTALEMSRSLPKEQNKSLELALKQALARTKLLLAKKQLSTGSLTEKIIALYNGVTDSLEGLLFLKNDALASPISKQYAEQFSQEQKEWLPSWQALNGLNESAAQPFNRAQMAYQQMIEATSLQHIQMGIDSAKACQQELLATIDQIHPNHPLKAKLTLLLDAYTRLQSRQSWPAFLIDLQEGLANALKLDATAEPEVNAAYLEMSRKQFSQAIDAAKNKTHALAQIFMQNAAQWVRLAIAQAQPISSLEILKTLIGQQRYLLHIEKDQTAQVSLDIPAGQQALQPLAELYFKAALQEQTQAFRQDKACQASPWNAALPLFSQAKQAALEASENLKDSNPNWQAIAWHQNQALELWQKSLAAIMQPSPTATCYGGLTNQSSSPSGGLESLSKLLQMEMEDRQPMPASPLKIDVSRPW